MLWSVMGGFLFLALGIFIFLKPDLIWKLTEEWKSYGAAEPSDFYRLSTKAGGILLSLLGMTMVILPWILE